MHRTQINLEPEQYRWLKQRAGRRSIAAVVRELIDDARARPADPRVDPALSYLLGPPATGAGTTTVTTLDDDVYGR